MGRKDVTPTTRVQVYFEDSRIYRALVDEAAATGASFSRAAERAISRGLARRLPPDPDDRIAALEQAVRAHGRAMARDMTFVQELLAQFARELFTVLPERPSDRDPVYQAAVELRVERFIDDTVARITSPPKPANASAQPQAAVLEDRSFQAPAE